MTDGHQHPTDLPEVDHHGPSSQRLHAVREAIAPLLTLLSDMLHDHEVVQPGQQWTIPLQMSCGFKGDIVLRVRQLGDCKPHRSAVPSCTTCGGAVDRSSFRDELSVREWGISGLCQTCQDIVFADEED